MRVDVQSSGRWWVAAVIIILTTAAGAGTAYWFQTLPPNVAVQADVIQRTVRVDRNGLRTATVRWEEGFGSHVRTVVIPDGFEGRDRVPLEHVDGDYRVAVPSGVDWVVTGFAGLVGALFGVAVVGASAGFGFVRGQGEPGTMTQTDVSEAHGFYWRS